MPRYTQKTLDAMKRAKEPSIINFDYVKERYLNKNPITKEEIEDSFKEAFADIFNNIFQAEIESELGYTKYDYKNKLANSISNNGNTIIDISTNENNNKNNSRNGYSKKTLRSDIAGDFEVNIPRDRNGTYEPILVPKYEKDISSFEDKIMAMYAKGMSTEAINGFMRDIYKISVSTEQVSRITDKILPIVKEWQSRPLKKCYSIIYLDGTIFDVLEDNVYVKKTAYIILGIDLTGHKDVLGIWIGEKESSKYWLKVLTEIKERGVEDIFIACIDGLSGFKEAIKFIFPNTQIQRCVIHMIRNSVKFVSYKDLKSVCTDLKLIYKANNEEEGYENRAVLDTKWKSKYPYISKIWRDNWNEIKTMFQYPREIKKIIYTTNTIESFNNGIKRITKTKGSFRTDNSLLKLMYLITQDLTKKWIMAIPHWSEIFNQFNILFEDRMSCFLKTN